MATTPHRFEALDSWRGICALMVALLHFEAFSHLKDLPFFNDAYLFVDFFFVLSGFVIAANYRQRLANGFGIGKLKEYCILGNPCSGKTTFAYSIIQKIQKRKIFYLNLSG